MLAAQSKQKGYANPKCWDIDFQIGDMVFLRILPMKGIKLFGEKGKLNPRFIGPFEILVRIWQAMYRLAMPPVLGHKLRMYVSDSSHILSDEALGHKPGSSYEEHVGRCFTRI
ncbi:uncharacterized protein LOC115695029 [Cannabis sativa]|uniref:uncharacterized protein LOC115695029 n=1 Tax=Cannabis sativa TaxID=3483 RepID=UPI0011DF9060|nr:uncharacterized protein LOC115695029 [Cannabis sativa]